MAVKQVAYKEPKSYFNEDMKKAYKASVERQKQEKAKKTDGKKK